MGVDFSTAKWWEARYATVKASCAPLETPAAHHGIDHSRVRHLELSVPAWRARAHPAGSRWAWWARAHREGASRAAVCAHDCCCRPARELRRVAQPAAADAERSKMSAVHGKYVARGARSSARAPCARIARHVKHVAA